MAKASPAPVTDDLDDDSSTQSSVDSVTETPNSAPSFHKTSVGPASDPVPAGAKPASEAEPQRPRTVISSIRDPGIDFEDNPALVLKGLDAEKVKDYMRLVPCHVIESFKGRVQTKGGQSEPFSFVRHEVIRLPKWFALSHQKRLVIKE